MSDKFQIKLEPDMSVEPGHQVLVLPATCEGNRLACLLAVVDDAWIFTEDATELRIPHTAEVDDRIVELIDQLSHVRFSAPGLIQLTMEEAGPPTPGGVSPSGGDQ